MKKFKFMGVIALVTSLIAGCSCSKVDDKTYQTAVDTYKNTDAISFTRIETISKEGEQTYTRKKIEASYIFEANKTVRKMAYSLLVTENTTAGGSDVIETTSYYYSQEKGTLYNYSKIGKSQEERYKYTGVTYKLMFNGDVCDDLDCSLMIVGNFAPIYGLDEIIEFRIDGKDGSGTAYYKGICPGFESCESNSQMIEYTLHINQDGNIDSLSYEFVNGKITHSVKYAFSAYGSNNVNITFPNDLESYIEK